MDILQQFYSSEPMREAVRLFFIAQLEKRAIEKVFNKQAVAGVYEAKKTLEEAFEKLSEMYEPKKPASIESSR